MGTVYKAEDTRLKRTVALKFLPPDLTRDPEAKQRFVQEAQAASALDHPNICNIHEIDETEDGQMFICMACYEGETLKKKIEQGPLKLEEAIDIAIQVVQGLAKTHSKTIVHRDIKPANILITEDGQVKIVDFGLAKLAGQTRITKKGTTLGTVAYMSPEQARGGEIDHRTDIWSLGVVLYEMLTGQLPFKGEHEDAVIYSILYEVPQPISELRSDVPVRLQQVLLKMMQKEVQKRYEDMEALITDLKFDSIAYPKPLLVKAFKKTLKRKSIQRILIPVAAVVVLGITFLLTRTFLFQEAKAAGRKSIAVMPFENLTGDRSLDHLCKAIPNLLITSLEQSQYLSVMTWERMRDLLKAMGKGDMQAIDEDLGVELCRMDDIDAILVGSFTKAGDLFATDVKVLDINSKRLMQSASSKGEGVQSILQRQIDELSKDIYLGVGIPEQEIETTQLPIAEYTTISMDAYNYFLRGREEHEKFYFGDARKFLEKAIELDSTFAMAYLYLAMTYGALGNIKARNEALEKAKTLVEKAADKERLWIEAFYAWWIENNREKFYRITKQIAEKYPKEKGAHYWVAQNYGVRDMFSQAIEEYNKILELDPNYGLALNDLAYVYASMGDHEKAIEYLKRYASVSPGDANPFDTMADVYLRMGKLDDAIAKYKEAVEVKSDFHQAYCKIAYIYALKEDYTEAMKWVDQFIAMAPSIGTRAEGYMWKGYYHYWLGSFEQALSEIDKAVDLSRAVGHESRIAFIDWMKGYIYYARGDLQLARRYFKGYFGLGFVDLKEGLIDSAKSKLAEMKSLLSEKDLPLKDWITFYYDLLYSEVLLAEDSLEKTIAICQKISPLEIPPTSNEGSYQVIRYNIPFLKDVLARAYLQNVELDKAIAEYEGLITFDPNSKDRYLIHPKYHYRLAKLYEEKDLSVKAIEQYKKFLEIWKDADKDLPELIDAKARLAKLLEEK